MFTLIMKFAIQPTTIRPQHISYSELNSTLNSFYHTIKYNVNNHLFSHSGLTIMSKKNNNLHVMARMAKALMIAQCITKSHAVKSEQSACHNDLCLVVVCTNTLCHELKHLRNSTSWSKYVFFR